MSIVLFLCGLDCNIVAGQIMVAWPRGEALFSHVFFVYSLLAQTMHGAPSDKSLKMNGESKQATNFYSLGQ